MTDRLTPAEKHGTQTGADSAQNTSMIDEVFHSGKDLVKSIAYTGIAEPILGVSQIVDKAAGTHSMDSLGSALSGIGISAPDQATGTLDKHAQMVGNAVGMLLPYLLLHKAVRGAAVKAFGEDAIASRADLALLGKSSFGSFAAKEAGLSFATGFSYDAVFRPSDDKKTGLSFVADRALNGTVGGTTMAALTASSLGLARIGSSEAVTAPWAKTMLTNPMSTGVISAIPAGLAGSEVTALRQGKLTPSLAEAGQNIYQMGFTGLALGGAHLLSSPHEGTSRTNLQYYATDPLKSRFFSSDAGKSGGDATPTVADAAEVKTEPTVISGRDRLTTGELQNIETPMQRAERLGRVKDVSGNAENFEQSKVLYFANANAGDGSNTDVVLRPFNSEPADLMRVYRADVSDRVNAVTKDMTGIDSPALPLVIRDNVTVPKINGANYEVDGTVTGPVMVQENGGKQLGQQLRDWAHGAAREKGAEPVTGDITNYLNENPEARALIARAAFDNMYKGNVDLVEFSQQTLPDGNHSDALQPSANMRIASIDNKNDFTDLQQPSWGFGAQFGLSLEVAKALEGKRLSEISPQLQTDAESLLKVYSSEQGMKRLTEAGLSEGEIAAARSRLTSLVEKGFPKHIGEMNFYADPGTDKQLTASLNTEYDLEAENIRNYLDARNQNVTVVNDNGQLRVVPKS